VVVELFSRGGKPGDAYCGPTGAGKIDVLLNLSPRSTLEGLLGMEFEGGHCSQFILLTTVFIIRKYTSRVGAVLGSGECTSLVGATRGGPLLELELKVAGTSNGAGSIGCFRIILYGTVSVQEHVDGQNSGTPPNVTSY
jgi:hypothetical protein